MKYRHRALALLLSFVMVLTFMPALAFADDEEEFYGELEIEREDCEYPLYNDGKKGIDIYPDDDGTGYSLKFKVGVNPDRELSEGWDSWTEGLLTEGEDFVYNESKERLYLDGTKIWEKLNGKAKSILVAAAFINDKNECVTYDVVEVSLAEATEEVDFTFNNAGYDPDEVQLFPGETDRLKQVCYAEVENSKYPEGEFFDNFKVTAAASSNTDVFTVTKKAVKNSKGKVVSYYWILKGINNGEAELNITFTGLTKGEKETIPVKVTKDKLYANIDHDMDNTLLPGESIDYSVSAWYESYDFGYDEQHFTYEWYIDEKDKDFAEVTPDADDPSKATLTLTNADFEDRDRKYTVHAIVSYKTKNGYVVSKDVTNFVYAEEEDWRIELYDTEGKRFEKFDRDMSFLDIGSSVTVVPKTIHAEYDKENHVTTYTTKEDDVRFKWLNRSKAEKASLSITNNNNGSYTFKRVNGGEVDFDLEAHWTESVNYGDEEDPEWEEEDVTGSERYFWFPEISTDLSEYHCEFADGVGTVYGTTYFIDPSNEGITPEIKLVDWNGYELPKSEYTLVLRKQNPKTLKFAASSFPLTFNVNNDTPYENGKAIYSVYAKPATKRFKSKTVAEEFQVCSEKSIVFGAGEVNLAIPFLQYRNRNWNNRYDLPLDVQLTEADIEVLACAGDDSKETKLAQGTDYNIKFEDWLTGEVTEGIPAKAGGYNIVAEGTGDYYGTNGDTMIFLGEKNPLKVKKATKSVKLAKVKKKKQITKPLTVTGAKGKVRYEKWGGSSRLIVSKTTGKVTVKKGTKKGTYHAWIAVTAAGDDTYAPERQMVYITIKVVK